MKYLFMFLFLFCSCKVHNKHLAISRYFIVKSISGKYLNVYSPPTSEALTHLDFIIHYPWRVDVGDTLVIYNNGKMKRY
jgi:hypothetical protein